MEAESSRSRRTVGYDFHDFGFILHRSYLCDFATDIEYPPLPPSPSLSEVGIVYMFFFSASSFVLIHNTKPASCFCVSSCFDLFRVLLSCYSRLAVTVLPSCFTYSRGLR